MPNTENRQKDIIKKVVIAVAGDPAIDIFEEAIPHHKVPDGGRNPAEFVEGENSVENNAGLYNWQSLPGYAWHRKQGGVLLLSDMLSNIFQKEGSSDWSKNAMVWSTQLDVDNSSYRSCVIRSLALIRQNKTLFMDENESQVFQKTFRVSQFLGFSGPRLDEKSTSVQSGLLKELYGEHSGNLNDNCIAVIDDAGNGFADDKKNWPNWLQSGTPKPGYLVVKLTHPLPPNAREAKLGRFELWNRISEWDCPKITIVSVGELRRSNIDISYGLSWDHTFRDICYWALHNENFKALCSFGHVIIRIGIEGAVLLPFRTNGPESATLICEPGTYEDAFDDRFGGHMPGGTSAFTAAMVAELSRDVPTDEITEEMLLRGINSGLTAAARMVKTGWTLDSQKSDLFLPYDEIFKIKEDSVSGEEIFDDDLELEIFTKKNLKDFSPKQLPELELMGFNHDPDDLYEICKNLAEQIVVFGVGQLRNIPHARIGGLTTADRKEIEDYRHVTKLVRTYLRSPTADKPLSIAVFGPPGSGKSFGINCIAKALSDDSSPIKIVLDESNVAQWRNQSDLTATLHSARDISLEGKIPLVFLDEFDSSLGDSNVLAWLKYFLAPMQDGKFKDGDRIHSISRLIFVFAGGTSHSFEEFQEQDETIFQAAKGPDFISRLSGFINIQGIDPTEICKKADIAKEASQTKDLPPLEGRHLIRRALILRSMLERNHKSLFDENGRASIDPSVVSAFLEVSKYCHGARSMQAIIRMSNLPPDAKHFAQSTLPSDEQLALHTKYDSFRQFLHGTKI